MALSFVPRPGSIVMCDFTGYMRPEILKRRHVIVISPYRKVRSIDHATVIVVPLSETAPNDILAWHYPIPAGRYRTVSACWAKGDLVSHVSLARLDRLFDCGRRIVPVIVRRDLVAIRRAVAAAIALS
jgi:uncharacterized protein YifN (PemK superfamily)